MRQTVLLLAAVFLLGGCCPSRRLTAESNRRDSTRIEVRTQIIHVPDTVYLEIPQQQSERTTADSTSHLENDYAVSNARINPDGTLFHNLNTKPQRKPLPTEKEIIRNDSIVYKDRYVNKNVTKEVPRKLTTFQRIQIYGFWILAFPFIFLFGKKIAGIRKMIKP